MRNIFLLKDVAMISGQSIHTIKYYLKIGLIKEAGRTPNTNFRFFDDSTIKVLNNIHELRLKKTSLKEIKNILAEGGGV